MDDQFDLFAFASYVRQSWHSVAICCAVAVALAAGISLALPKRYTSTASVLIDPPAGNDPRAATAVSPVYLESLKTYERIASSDSLFVKALKQVGVAEGASEENLGALKRRILNVSKPANTKVLEISATLKNPGRAQALAQYLAEQTAALAGSLDDGAEDDLTREGRAIVAAATVRLSKANEARERFLKTDPVEALDAEISNASELSLRLRRDIGEAKGQLSEYLAQQQTPAATDQAFDAAWVRRQIAALRARLEQLEQQDRDTSRTVADGSSVLEKRRSRREALEAELRAARTEYESAKTKLNDIRASAAFRGERLRVIDPGVVPSSPSSPNLPLNVMCALLLALVTSLVHLAIRYGRVQARSAHAGRAYSLR